MTSFATYPGLVTSQNAALPQWTRAGILLVAWFRIYPPLTHQLGYEWWVSLLYLLIHISPVTSPHYSVHLYYHFLHNLACSDC